MRILVVLHDASIAEDTLRFAAQFVHCADESSLILAVVQHNKKSGLLTMAGRFLPGMQTRTRTGNLAQETLAEVREGEYDLLIVGESPASNGYGGLLRRGSTCLWLVEHCPCPVVVVKDRVTPVKRILLCDSGSETSLLSRFVLQVAGLLEGEEEVTVLHVMSQISAGPGVRGAQLRADADELIQNGTPEGKLLMGDIQILGKPGIHPVAKVRHGLVVDEILDEAQQGDYDLVVIGAHRMEGWQRFLLEDLAREILEQMERPVLVVR